MSHPSAEEAGEAVFHRLEQCQGSRRFMALAKDGVIMLDGRRSGQAGLVDGGIVDEASKKLVRDRPRRR